MSNVHHRIRAADREVSRRARALLDQALTKAERQTALLHVELLERAGLTRSAAVAIAARRAGVNARTIWRWTGQLPFHHLEDK